MFAIKNYRKFDLRGRVSSSVTDETIQLFLSGLDCPRSLTIWLMYSQGEHDQLAAIECDPLHYNSASAFRDAYTATSFLSKASFLDTTFDRRDVALKKFRDAEQVCGSVNKRFGDLSLDPSFSGSNVWLLHATMRKIGSILGDYDVEEHLESCSWGPGATFSMRGALTSPVNKFRVCRGMTSKCYTLFNSVFPKAYPLWDRFLTSKLAEPVGEGSIHELLSKGRLKFEIEVGNRVICVPKNSKTDRVIAAEPGVNLWFQLGLGRVIVRRLYRNTGIDLTTQDRNQLLAFYGAKANNLATIDFSAASDTISTRVVEALLPPRWFDIMDSVRSMYGELPDGSMVRYEKFSSMGNGYTFPLQSLIFTAAALACCELAKEGDEYVGVFGDDVVIPVGAVKLFTEFCTFLGFTFNGSKSFSSGPFRESCGAHYFGGVDVKPLYLKERLGTYDSIYRLANGVRRLSHRALHGFACDRRFLHTWRYLFNKVPPPLRFVIPDGYGDGGFVGNFDEARPTTRRCGNWVEGYVVRHMTSIPIARSAQDDALLLARVFKGQTGLEYERDPVEERFYTGNLPLWALVHGEVLPDALPSGNKESRRRATRRSVAELHVKSWSTLGEWL